MTDKRAVIFDWDLTLWNSWDLHMWLLSYTAEILQALPPAPDVVAQEYGCPFLLHLERVLNLSIDRILPVYMGMYDRLVPLKGHLYDDITRTLERLRGQGARMAILSDKRETFGELELNISGIQDSFQYVSFLNAGREYKPSPSRLFEVCKELGVDKDQVVYIGDSLSDLQCAKSAGVEFGSAMWASLNGSALRSEAEYVFEQPYDIISAVAGS